MSSFRTEQDSLGSVNVPKDALYGAQTMRAVENFPISGRTAAPALIRAYLRLKRAAAVANRETGALSAERADRIVRAADTALSWTEQRWRAEFPVDSYQAGAGTSQNMNANEVLANLASQQAGEPLGTYRLIHPNDDVNRSQSTNDTYPTVMRLALLDASKSLCEELDKLGRSFGTLAGRWGSIPKSARTHLQDAVPMTLGQELGGYAATVFRLVRYLESAREDLKELGIGGSAAGTGLNVPRGYRERIVAELSTLTGEKLRLAPNLFEAMQSQAPVGLYSSALRLMALELTRICNDLRLLASGPQTGFAEVLLPAAQPGSSIMPGKVNPSLLEMANQAWFSVLGYDHATGLALQAGQLELNVMMPIMAYSQLEATEVSRTTLSALRTRCIDGILPLEDRLRRYFESTPQVATALSPKLGYEKTAELVKHALAEGRSVLELVREQKLLTERELGELLDVERLTGMKH